MAHERQNQPYDNLLKRLAENQAHQIIPLLFSDLVSEVLEELHIEVLIPPRRTDRVYKTRPEDPDSGQEIMHIEFESSVSGKMDERLLIYHSLLLEKYELPMFDPLLDEDPRVQEIKKRAIYLSVSGT